MAKITVGRKVLVKNLSLSYSDYRNLDGEVMEVHGDYASVAVAKKKISVEDLRDLRLIEDRAVVKVKLANIA
jgi:hypothetical protein